MPHFTSWAVGWPVVVRAFGYAVLVGLVTLGLAIAAAVINLVYFNDPPVTVANIDASYTQPLCPGQEVIVHKRIATDQPLQLFSYFDVMDETMREHYTGAQTSNGPRSYPAAGIYHDRFLWTVPDLPRGRYARIFTVRGTDGRENSIFTWVLFEIGDCP